jgi:hypothetical protein
MVYILVDILTASLKYLNEFMALNILIKLSGFLVCLLGNVTSNYVVRPLHVRDPTQYPLGAHCSRQSPGIAIRELLRIAGLALCI